MKTHSEIIDIRKARWTDPLATWGLIPTMGCLHEGHLGLVRRAGEENDRVGVSIFVNPSQFNNPEDLATYPRRLDRDLAMLEKEGVDLVWTPSNDIVYPPDYQTVVDVTGVTAFLEGPARPGHFRGVAAVVAKLFNVFQPHRAYFGQKDAQQVVVIGQMARDLNFNVDIVACSTAREADGLAMSSRNANLSDEARRQAPILNRALVAARDAFAGGERNADRLRASMLDMLRSASLARPDYVSAAHPDTLKELTLVEDGALLSMAVFMDGVRLIDNIVVG